MLKAIAGPKLALGKGRALLALLAVTQRLADLLGLKRLYRRHVRRLIERTGLFDAAYYTETYPELSAQGITPISHYIAYGDRQGRQPMPIFDPAYVRDRIKGPFKRCNTILYYTYVGRYLGVSPGPWFDVVHYLRENPDVASAGIDPLQHYLQRGGMEGRTPYRGFDGAYYLRANPDVAAARLNPLLHFLRVGRIEGRSAVPPPATSDSVAQAAAVMLTAAIPSPQQWSAMVRRSDPCGAAAVDVLVPVYKDRELTLRCLYSVLSAAAETPFELIVIDDHSPDAELTDALVRLAEDGLLTLLRNSSNRGFVYSVNRGMQLHGGRDVVLLNSDTEVFGDWLDRLRAAAYRHVRTGTVTPLSNNATICSYPCFLYDNPYPLELPYEQLDALAARVNPGFETEAPTGVGFCLYLRRDCIDAIGLFDEQTFGRGYGEENDFCQRALQQGWRNILVADTFVRHWGGASFRDEKAHQVAAALKTIDRLYPEYRTEVKRFIGRDPLAEARRRLDWARLLRHVQEQNTLVVSGKDSEALNVFLRKNDLPALKEDRNTFYLLPLLDDPARLRLVHPQCTPLPNLAILDLADGHTFTNVLSELRINCIRIENLTGLNAELFDNIERIACRLGISLAY